MKVYGNLERAQLESRTSDYAAAMQGALWFDSALNKIKIADGTIIKSFLLNDNQIFIGTSGTAGTNVRLNRSGVAILQFLPDNDVTVEGSSSAGPLAQLSSRNENFTNLSLPAFGNAGRIVWNSDQLKVQVDTGSSWIAVGTGGGSDQFQLLRQKFHNELYGNITPSIGDSTGSGFGLPDKNVSAELIQNYTTPATTVAIVLNPLYLSSTDKDTTVTTGWALENAAANLTTSATVQIGASSISFDKNNSNVNAHIQFDRGAGNFLGVPGWTDLYFWINMPAITQLLNVEVRMDIDNTNYETFTQTLDHTGAPIAVGWNLMKFDLTTGGVATGTGWTPSLGIRYFHVGINTTVSAQTYAGILINGIKFSRVNPQQFMIPGNFYTAVDTANISDFQLDSATPRVVGLVTLTSALTSNFIGGFVSSVQRNTLGIVGNGMAAMKDGLSGTVENVQVARTQMIFPKSVTSTYRGFTDVNTPLAFQVVNIPNTTQIQVADTTNWTAQLVSGVTFHIFQTIYSDGVARFIRRDVTPGDLTVSSLNSSNVLGVTTINNNGTNSGVQVGDYVVVKHIDSKISVVPLANGESFQTPTLDAVLMENLGLPFPFEKDIWAYWPMGVAAPAVNTRGIAPNLTVTGAGFTLVPALNGEFGLRFTGASFFQLPNGATTAVAATGVEVIISLWFIPDSFTGAQRALISRIDPGAGGRGWDFELNSTTNELIGQNDTAGLGVAAPFIVGKPNHFLASFKSGTIKVWLNGTLILNSSAFTISDNGNFDIGTDGYAQTLTGCALYQILMITGRTADQGIVNSIYNNGQGRVFNLAPFLSYQYSLSGTVGQKISWLSTVTRTTDAAQVFLGAHGALATG